MADTTASKLRQLRERAGFESGRAFGRALGLVGNAYQYYERNRDKPLPMALADKIAAVLGPRGINPADVYALAGVEADKVRPGGLADADVAEWPMPASPDRRAAAVRAFCLGQGGWHPWVIRGRALALAGYLPGDVLIIDHDRTRPDDGAVVCAQIYDWRQGAARTVLRLLDGGFLVAASADPAYRRPLALGDAVAVKGTAVACIRALDC